MDFMTAATAFRAQQPGESIKPEWREHLRGMVPPTGFPTQYMAPTFTVLNETGAENLYSDDYFCLYLNHSLPYRELYPNANDRAGMSFVHMLACPRERIYNAVTLEAKDRPLLEHMAATVSRLVDSDVFRRRVYDKLMLKFWPSMQEGFTDEVKAKFIAQSNLWLNRTSGRNMGYYFHLHPHHSVGHLHMHCLADNIRTNNLHNKKNTSLDDVIDMLV
jgi:hypothetical protein